MQGVRLPDAVWGEAGPGWDAWRERQPGDYMRVEWPKREPPEARVTWYICDPLGKAGQIGGRRIHLERIAYTEDYIPVLQPPVVAPWKIEEHGDGTISVSPSIMDDSPLGWHGWLERGVWREC